MQTMRQAKQLERRAMSTFLTRQGRRNLREIPLCPMETPRVVKRNPIPDCSPHHFGKCWTNCLVQGKSGTYMRHPQGMPKELNLFTRFFSGLALHSLRYQASRIRGKGPDSTGILRCTPGTALCFNAFLTSSDPFLCRPPWDKVNLSSGEG